MANYVFARNMTGIRLPRLDSDPNVLRPRLDSDPKVLARDKKVLKALGENCDQLQLKGNLTRSKHRGVSGGTINVILERLR